MTPADTQLAFERLTTRRVSFTVSDPWEFGTAVGVGPHFGHILRVRRQVETGTFGIRQADAAVIQVERPFSYLGLKGEFFIVTPRHEGMDLCGIETPEGVAANFVRLSRENAESRDPFNLALQSDAKVVALIGTLSVATV